MRLKYIVPEFEYSVHSLVEFLKLSQSLEGELFKGMGATILSQYPELGENEISRISNEELLGYIQDKLSAKYRAVMPEMLEKRKLYQEAWDIVEKDVERTLTQIFGVDLAEKYDQMLARVNLNPIMPRFLEDHSFDIFYLYSDRAAVYVALHEITHFIWFQVWHSIFNDKYELYEQPHLPWIISELSIDAILTDARLNGYIKNEQMASQPAYSEFYRIETAEGRLIDFARDLYTTHPMEQFMEKLYRFCKQNEAVLSKDFH